MQEVEMVATNQNDPTDFSDYQSIVNAFETGQADLVEKAIGSVATELQKDKNFGLAKEALTRMTQRKVRKLSDVYTTLGFDEISAKTGLKADIVISYFMNLIAQNLTRAQINSETKTVQFNDDSHNSLDLVHTLEQQNLRIIKLMDKAAAMNVTILTN